MVLGNASHEVLTSGDIDMPAKKPKKGPTRKKGKKVGAYKKLGTK